MDTVSFQLIKTELLRVMVAKFTEVKCKVYRINGVENHLHILVDIHPSVAASTVIQKVKLAASAFLTDKYPDVDFPGWRTGYASITFNKSGLNSLMNYVANQEEHHKQISLREEYIQLLQEHGIEYDPRFLPDDE